jgi:hypothetical protein
MTTFGVIDFDSVLILVRCIDHLVRHVESRFCILLIFMYEDSCSLWHERGFVEIKCSVELRVCG